MNKAALILALLICPTTPSNSQTPTEASAKYPVVTSYEVRPGILMTPRYTVEGQVCEMWIQKQNATRSGVRLDSYMSDELIKDIVEELVPPSVRGKSWRGKEWDGAILIVGVATIVTYGYENLSITVSERTNDARMGPRIVEITWKGRTCKDEGKPLSLDKYPG